MNKYLITLLFCSSLFGLDISILEKNSHSLTARLVIPEPTLSPWELGKQTVHLPRWPDAYLSYDSTQKNMVPMFTISILLPPSGELPGLQVLNSELREDRRLSKLTIQAEDLKIDHEIPFTHAAQWVELEAAENFRSYKTARIIIYPYVLPGQRLSEITIRLDFPKNVPRQKSHDIDLIGTYLNAEMGAERAQSPPNSLRKTAPSLPQGQWFRFPVNRMGIHRIKPASFTGGAPTSDPLSWQVYAPFYEGQSLPYALSETEPTPDNLKPISMSGTGLDDGVFSANDEIIFFAQALNGDFKGDNFNHLYGKQRYYWLNIPNESSQPGKHVSLLAESVIAPTNTITSYEKRLYHETDLHNQLHSGETWVGEKLTGTRDQFSIIFNDDYLDRDSEIQLSTLFIIDYDNQANSPIVDVELNGDPFNINQTTLAYSKQIIVSGTASENMLQIVQNGSNTLRLNYSSSSSNSIVYLDSLRLSYDRYLAPSDDYLFGTVDLNGAVNRLEFQNLTDDFHLWDISDPSDVIEWDINNSQFTLEESGKHEIIGFADNQVIDLVLEPASDLGNPQLRRADWQANYLIITPDLFLDQAERIRELREEQVHLDDQLDVEIISIEDIYDEFSAGTVDPAAIKHFLHYVYFSPDAPLLRYVLFLGDTDYDYRNITGQSKMHIPTFQQDGLNDINSYPTDDKYTYIASGIRDELPDIAIGRLPAQTPDQMEIMVDKIIAYELTPDPGIWRNSVTLVADDLLRPSLSLEREHILDSEDLGHVMPSSMHVDKVYLTEYPEVQDPNSPYIKKPKAKEDLLQKLYNGTLLVNYFGHGSPNVWAQEDVFSVSDMGLVKTGMRLPFWVAGTCDWAKYDDVNSSCVPEELMLMESNGAVGILSTTRKTYSLFNNILLSHFFNFLFPELDAGRSISVGEAIMIAKNQPRGSEENNEKYILFSDPALRLASPERKGQIETISPSVFQAMGKVNYFGSADTSLAPDAQAAVTVYDTPTWVTRSIEFGTNGAVAEISYMIPGKRIFRGLISVDNREFSGKFTLPKDIKYSGEGGILRVQYWDETGLDGSIFIDTLKFLGTDSTTLDGSGPEILFISDNMVLLNGDHFSANEALEIEIDDEQGINLTGAAGHGITLAIDEDWGNAYDMTELFEYDLDRSDLGRLSALLSKVPPGEHLVSVKAWDSQNNPNEASIRLEFFAANDFRVYDLFNFPNPMMEDTEITYMLSHPADVQIAIYTLAGRKIMDEAIGYQAQGFNSFPWEGEDSFGSQLANGIYILVVEAENDAFDEPTQTIQKLVIAR